MLSGDNGLLTRTTEAKERTGISEVVENAKLDVLAQIAENKGGNISKEQLKSILNKYFDDIDNLELPDDLSNSDIKLNANQTYGGYKNIALSDIYNGTFGNQIEDIDYAPYDNPYIPRNFSHITGTTWNAGFTIKGDAGTANAGDEFIWVPCVTDQTKVKPGDTVQTFEKHFSILTDETDSDWEDAEHNAYMGVDYASLFSDEGSSASSIRTSVQTFGGFYIAKYEAGITGTTDNYCLTTKTATDGSVKPLSQEGKGVWNYIARTDAITVAEVMIPTSTECKSALISGECWDTTMQWIKQTTNSDYDVNSDRKRLL